MKDINQFIKRNRDSVISLKQKFTDELYRDIFINFSRLLPLLEDDELELVDWYLALSPGDLGYKAEYIGRKTADKNDFIIEKREIRVKNKDKRYLQPVAIPKHIKPYWEELNQAIETATGTPLVILSAYRSPAYQTLLINYLLHNQLVNHVDADPTLVFSRVNLPGYSQHNDPINTAFDIGIRAEAVGQANSLEQTSQYQWLLDNANRYNFHLSYPKNNSDKRIFEPWHWRFNHS